MGMAVECKEILVPERCLHIGMIGPIGSGKSALAGLLGANLNVPRYPVSVFEERFPKNPFLEGFYRNPEEFSYRSQSFFLKSKVGQLGRVNEQLQRGGVIVDPAVEMDFMFAEAQWRMGWMTSMEFTRYVTEYSALTEANRVKRPDIFVIVNADPDVIRKRVLERGRPFELKTVSTHPEYFDILHGLVKNFYDRRGGMSPSFLVDSGRVDFVNSPQGRADAVGEVLSQIGYYYGMNSRSKGISPVDGARLIMPNYIK